ncbi:MAG: helix-turn-helix domain-containing protein [Dysgonomonas sp.]
MWVSIPLKECALIVGPVLLGEPKVAYIEKRIKGSLASVDGNAIAAYMKLPILPYLEIMRICTHLFYILMENTVQEPVYTKHQSDFSLTLTDDEMYDSQERDFRASRRAELFLHDCVLSGSIEKLGRLQSMAMPKIARIANDDLRKVKNSFIVTLVIVSRAAIAGGLPLEMVYPLSDVYLMQNETLSNAAQIWELHQTCVMDFTRRVHENQQVTQYGDLVERCIGYMLANIGENLKVKEIASFLEVTPEHLSRQFKQETGNTILQYIHTTKINEAKNLLRFTDLEIVKIAVKLGFISQSQFSTLFKNQTGTTPAVYRNRRRK